MSVNTILVTEPLSRQNIRDYAFKIRKNLGIEDKLYFPVVEFLEMMPDLFPSFTSIIEEDSFFPEGVFAYIDIINHVMYIRESVYDGACNDDGFSRFTIAHEIGHYLLLCVSRQELRINRGEGRPKIYRSPEWQADVFAGELLMPSHLIRNMEIDDIMGCCAVSRKAAETQSDACYR